ncbi:MAG: radical SAM/SPASM family putative metalloenzyme maturase [Deltaproteobacteria bacterium]|nr:radical SAM/SPASM family putative metalloenzyme maturase [Deltaproteobacteria bacterium]
MEETGLKRLVVETTSLCNLSCKMCVKNTFANGACSADGSMSEEMFLRMEDSFASLESLVLNGVGEPLLNPSLVKFIARAAAKMPSHAQIGFQTNGTLFDADITNNIIDAGANTICLSVDSLNEEFLINARGVGIATLEKALVNLNNARDRSGRKNVRLGIEVVLMKDNFMELPLIAQWAINNGVSFILVSQLMPYSRLSANDIAYDTNTQSAIAIYKKWIQKAETEKLDFERYYAAFMRFDVRSDEKNLRLLNLAKGMMAEADSEGVYLHVENLLKRDEEYLSRVKDVLTRTEALCNKHGVKLTVPEIAPRNTRRCEFVEENTLFVSYDGQVSPCYFLWHRFNCYIGAVENRVVPWLIGSLQESTIEEIWRGEAYQKFRKEVLKYSFPFCFDCSFALCDYVSEENFQQDCYLVEVPCATCLWCTGLFHCLY